MFKQQRLVLLLTAACLVWWAPMASADKPIVGSKITLRDPIDSTQRRFTFLSKDTGIVFGSNADSDTPTVHGASVLLFNPTTSECQCIIMPAPVWAIGADGRRYAYRDPAQNSGPVKLAFIKAGKLKVVAKGSSLTGVTLNETEQSEMAVHYTSGNAGKLCAHFAPSSVRADQPGAFIAVNALAPAACLPEPAGCTPCAPPIIP